MVIKKILQSWLILAILEGIGVSIALLIIPADSKQGGVFGFSPLRLVLIGGVLLITLLLAFFLWYTIRRESLDQGIMFTQTIKRGLIYWTLVIFSFLVVLVGSQLYHLVTHLEDTALQNYFARLAPLLLWSVLLGLQTLIILPILRNGSFYSSGMQSANVRASLIVFAIFLVFWGVVILTGWGIKPDTIGWHAPGVPILPVQVWLAWLVGLGVLAFGLIWRPRAIFFDILMVVLLWVGTAWLWSSQPLKPDFFALRPVPPNFDFAPFSDASAYDMTAHRLLIGEGFGGLALKPMYAFFLAVLHRLAGFNYESVVGLQVWILALLPVLIYALGCFLHHRMAGSVAAVLVSLREANAINLSGFIGVSHAKLMLSDLSSAVIIAGLTLLLVIWLRNNKWKMTHFTSLPILTGGLLGMLLLIRPQVMVLIPAVLILVVLGTMQLPWRQHIKRPLFAVIWVLVGVGLSVSGWMYITWRETGVPVLNDPWQTAYMTSVYRLNPNEENVDLDRLPQQPGETLADYNTRIQQVVGEFIRQYPDVVIRFVAGHYLHNQIESLLILPDSPWFSYAFDSKSFSRWKTQFDKIWEDCCSLKAYIGDLPYWRVKDNTLSSSSVIPLLINLAVIALGIGGSWKRQRWIALLPLWIEAVYLLSVAIGRQSGWRFTLPVDWVVILYYAIGITECTLWLGTVFVRKVDISSDVPVVITESQLSLRQLSLRQQSPVWLDKWAIAVLLFVFLLGWMPQMMIWFTPVRFPHLSEEALFASFASEKQMLKERAGNDLLSPEYLRQHGILLYRGLALYPRYYRSGQGEPSSGWQIFRVKNFNRLGFYLMGPDEEKVLLALDKPPQSLPNGRDVLVIGCPGSAYVDALAVITYPSNGNISSGIILRSPIPSTVSCPFPAP